MRLVVWNDSHIGYFFCLLLFCFFFYKHSKVTVSAVRIGCVDWMEARQMNEFIFVFFLLFQKWTLMLDMRP